MRLRIFALLSALALVCPAYGQGFVSVSSSKLFDASGALVQSATVCAAPVDPMGNPASILVGGGGVTITTPVCVQATAGAWSMQLPNTQYSKPGNACFNVTATDNLTGNSLIGPGFSCVQPTTGPTTNSWCNGQSCNFDNLPPMSKPVYSTVYAGPQGPAGTNGFNGAAGAPGCVLGTTGCTVADPSTVDQSLNAATYPGHFAGIGELLDVGSAPILTVGASGAWDAGSIRDPSNAWIRNAANGLPKQMCLLYTGAKSNLPPYTRVSLGLACTSDLTGKTGWSKVANVLGPVGSNQWNSGAIFSPWVYYDSVADITTIYFSATVSPEQWYSGPSALGIAQVAAGADYSNPTNWVMQSSPALTKGQTFEEGQGLYAPSVIRIGNTWNMYYSSSASGTDFYVGLATASNPAGPFTKLADNTAWKPSLQNFVYNTNPVFGDGFSVEPSCAVLDNGQVQCFTDDPIGTLTPAGFKSFTSNEPFGIGGWAQAAPVIINNPRSYYSGHLGAMGQTQLSTGRFLLIANGSNDPSSQAVRSIDAFLYTLASPVAAQSAPKVLGSNGSSWGSTATVVCPSGQDCSLSFGSNAAHSGQVFYDHTNNVVRASSTGNLLNWIYEAPEFHVSTGSDFAAYFALGDRFTAGNVGLWRDQATANQITSNFLNADGYDGFRLWLGHAPMGNKGKELNIDCGFNYAVTQLNPAQPGSQGCRFVTGLAVGPVGTGTGTVFTNIVLRSWYSTPASVAPQSCSDVSTNVAGVINQDHVSEVAPPSVLGNLSLNAYMSATSGGVILHFCNPSTASVTPPAGNYSGIFYTNK